MIKKLSLAGLLFIQMVCISQNTIAQAQKNAPFIWEGANLYFMVTDRFNNGNPNNDLAYDRTLETGKLRGFEGGDIKGITKKLQEGYFEKLGINVIWFTPVFEQIHGSVNEGTGNTYAFHGYWIRDWTNLDANFGTLEELKELVDLAHSKGIRILLDVVLNHTGPVTDLDPAYPDDWARKGPRCTYQGYSTTIPCTLVENLPDVRTESNQTVNLPEMLLKKWSDEGRLKEEVRELDEFFSRTQYPRAPRFYIIKWLTDYIKVLGIDGYRIDTAKHLEESVLGELNKEAQDAFAQWKKANPTKALNNDNFYMLGEVYNYSIDGGRIFDFGDKKVDYYAFGCTSLVNFGFKEHAKSDYETLFSSYSTKMNGPLKGVSVLNYISSHDDGSPFDKDRLIPMVAGTKLLLTPGTSQVYYGDESIRPLNIPGAEGDATLRSFMNWEDIQNNATVNGVKIQDVLTHYQKLGTFRKKHPAIGAGIHTKIADTPYTFKREYNNKGITDKVVVALDLKKGKKTISVGDVFTDGTTLTDHYSGKTAVVKNKQITLKTKFNLVLLESK